MSLTSLGLWPARGVLLHVVLATRLTISCVLIATLCSQVVQAEDTAEPHAVVQSYDRDLSALDREAVAQPRYAGWLLGAYLIPTAVAVAALSIGHFETLSASAAAAWLLPATVHLLAREYGLAARSGLVVAFGASGLLVGGLAGVGIGALIPEDQYTREEDPNQNELIGLVYGGFIGAIVGAATWGLIDTRSTFISDGERRARSGRAQRPVVFGVAPLPSGMSASLATVF